MSALVERRVFVNCQLSTLPRVAHAHYAHIPLVLHLRLRTVKREELRVKSKEAVRLVWLASATARLVARLARLAARLARLEIAEIEKHFSNPRNHHILSVLRDFSRVSIYHSLSLFITLCHSLSLCGNAKNKSSNFAA